ncbi:DNA alkylation repair protein [Halobacillus locisalis]|uniref:DNA alkylation repair protein n=1 Tax=Halobacillus locisalis TaxID=220753 RepID=A0A838CT40_9BACI|nr:DNA alkylation repair protein [Halobacillus locisalis]MBA2174989.1 DNA alkylation repair protein [Halobacillus locisalis]
MTAYLCPGCKTNRSRFNIIEQRPRSIKMDPRTGEVTSEYQEGELDAFHTAYKGPDKKVQCGACGLIEDEKSFAAYAEHNKLS